MAKIFLFPEREMTIRQSAAAGNGGEVVSLKGMPLEATLETVAFLRSLEDQSYLDRFNRSRPVERDVAVERHQANLATERS